MSSRLKRSMNAKELILVALISLLLTYVIGGAIGSIFFVVFFLFALFALSTYMAERRTKNKKYATTGNKNISDSKSSITDKNNPKKNSKITTIISLVILLAFIGVGRHIGSLIGSGVGKSVASSSMTNEEYIDTAINQIRTSTTFPYTVDDVTRWDGVSGTESSIVYSYSIIGVDPADLDKSVVRNQIVSSACSTDDTKAILDRGISLDYSYSFENSDEMFIVSVSQSDCS